MPGADAPKEIWPPRPLRRQPPPHPLPPPASRPQPLCSACHYQREDLHNSGSVLRSLAKLIASCRWCADHAGLHILPPLRHSTRDSHQEPRCRPATCLSESPYLFVWQVGDRVTVAGHLLWRRLQAIALHTIYAFQAGRIVAGLDTGLAIVVVPKPPAKDIKALMQQIEGLQELHRSVQVVSGSLAPPPSSAAGSDFESATSTHTNMIL